MAVDDRGVVGTVTFVEPGSDLSEISREDEAEIRSLAVDPSAGGHGVGESLARHTVALARQRGFGAVVLSTSTTMHAAHRLYERLGFTRLPERDWSPVAGVQLVAYVLHFRARQLPGQVAGGRRPRRSSGRGGSTPRPDHRGPGRRRRRCSTPGRSTRWSEPGVVTTGEALEDPRLERLRTPGPSSVTDTTRTPRAAPG